MQPISSTPYTGPNAIKVYETQFIAFRLPNRKLGTGLIAEVALVTDISIGFNYYTTQSSVIASGIIISHHLNADDTTGAEIEARLVPYRPWTLTADRRRVVDTTTGEIISGVDFLIGADGKDFVRTMQESGRTLMYQNDALNQQMHAQAVPIPQMAAEFIRNAVADGSSEFR